MEKKYDYRLVAFIDILGFKSLIYDSEKNIDIAQMIHKSLRYFKKWESPDRWGTRIIEIEEDAQMKNLDDFKIEKKTRCSCFSDSIVISVEVKENKVNEAFSTLVANLSDMGNYLMKNRILIRGAITIGNLHHSKTGIIFGSGLVEAYQLESKTAIYPRIIISSKLIKLLKYPLISKRNRYPYHQYIKRFEDGCVGFHQMSILQVIQNSTVITVEDLKINLRDVKNTIINGLDDNFENTNVFNKYSWLKEEYEKLIILTDDVKENIHEPSESDSRHNVHYSYIDRVMNRSS